MSLINFNNQTNDSTKNDLYNSYNVIKKAYVFDGCLQNKKVTLKNKFIQKQLNNISNNDSKNYCLTSSNFLHKSNNMNENIITISNSNSNSFNLINNSLKDNIIYNKKNKKKLLSTDIKKIKRKLLSIKKNKLLKNSNDNNFIKSSHKAKTKNYYDMEKNRFNPILLYNNLTFNNNNKNDNTKINNNKTKLKELKFKVFHTIKNNYLPLCSHFISNAESNNKKILEYYSSDNYKKILKIYKKNFHYKMDIEKNPKIETYTDIPKINEQSSFTKKLNIDKLFTKEEKKLILLEPDYYFKNTNKDCFEDIKIIQAKTLAERINKEDKIKEEEIKKNKRKRCKTTNNDDDDKIDEYLNKTEIKKNKYKDDYMNEYKNNKRLIEKMIKKENDIKKEKEKKIINVQECFNKELNNGYTKYKALINKNKEIKYKKKPKFINKTDTLGMRNNLILNNYKHIIKHERLLKKMNKLNDESKSLSKSIKKEDLNNLNNNKQFEYIKTYINKIKNIYKKLD